MLDEIESYGESSAVIAGYDSPSSKTSYLKMLGVGESFVSSIADVEVFTVRFKENSVEEFHALTKRSSSISHFLTSTNNNVQRLLLPKDWLNYKSPAESATSITILDTFMIPSLTAPMNIMTEVSKHSIFRPEFDKFVLFFPSNNPTPTPLQNFRAVASSFFDFGSSSAKFVVIPHLDFPRNHPFSMFYLGPHLGHLDKDLIIFVETKGDLGLVRYELPLSSHSSYEDMVEFVNACSDDNQAGVKTPARDFLRLRSLPINEHYKNESLTSKVVDLSAGDLYDYVMSSTEGGRHAIVFFFSPTCQHSLGTLPLFSLASEQNVEKESGISFARMDASSNDIDPFFGGEAVLPGFPTLVNFYRGGEEGVILQKDYRNVLNGKGIDLEGLKAFAKS